MNVIYIISNNNLLVQLILYSLSCVCLLLVFLKLKKLFAKKEILVEHTPVLEEIRVASELVLPTDSIRNSVFLFGEFTVIDRKGVDISYLFSLKIRLLFVLILYRTLSDVKGITSKSLSLQMWPDKDPKESKNSRGVHLSRLRNLLQSLDGIELEFRNGKYTFVLFETFFCDYIELLKTKENLAIDILSITRRGTFLQHLYAEWIDEVKSEAENLSLTLLEKAVEVAFAAHNYPQTIAYCVSIFTFDSFSDVALRYMISSYLWMGNQKEAAKTYTGFCFSYVKSFGCEYPATMKELIIK